jgi:hypothetical protein
MRFFSCLFIVGTLSSCTSNGQTEYEFTDPNTSTRIIFNKVNDTTLTLKRAGDTATIKDYVNGYFTNHPAAYHLENIQLDTSPGSVIYLIYNFITNDSGYHYKAAFSIKIDNGKFAPDLGSPGGYGQTCTGVVCGCCSWIRNSKKQIIGCECLADPRCNPTYKGYCNHTITTGN